MLHGFQLILEGQLQSKHLCGLFTFQLLIDALTMTAHLHIINLPNISNGCFIPFLLLVLQYGTAEEIKGIGPKNCIGGGSATEVNAGSV